jgi:hypothetical protein
VTEQESEPEKVEPGKKQPMTKSDAQGIGCLVGIIAVVVLFGGAWIWSAVAGDSDDSLLSGDASARMACGHFRNIATDASLGVLAPEELRPKIQEVYRSASVSEFVPVRQAATTMLQQMTAGGGSTTGIEAMDSACNMIGE